MDSANLRAAAVARRAGVSASTLHRILRGSVSPTVETLEEIALACGFSLDLAGAQINDRFAAAAARSILEDGYRPPDDPSVSEWEQRLVRWTGSDEPMGLVQAAAKASSPLRRNDAVLFAGKETVARVASAGDASDGRWAISGPAGLTLDASPTAAAPPVTILWCEESLRASQMLADSALRAATDAREVTVAVVGGEPELFFDAFAVGIVQFASPIQIILDCVSQGGAVAKAALAEAATW
jgi:transcriptional regulator with XRE-family HTH domain